MRQTKFTLQDSFGSYFICGTYERISDERDKDFAIRLTKEAGVATIPVSVFLPTVFGNAVADFTANPGFRQYEFKLRELEIERRLKREKLKPKLDLKYNLLADGTRFGTPDGLAGYKYGVKFSYPILARTARAYPIRNSANLRRRRVAHRQGTRHLSRSGRIPCA